MKKSVSGQVMKFSPKLATIFFDDFFTYNNSCPPFRAPCMADFLMEFKRGHCTDAPFPLHREKMVMGMDMDMDVGIAMVMGEVGSQFEKRPKKVLKKVLKKSAKKVLTAKVLKKSAQRSTQKSTQRSILLKKVFKTK